MKPPVRFGVFEVDLEAGELRKHGMRIRLADQPFSILAVLLERPGQVVTRDELQRTLWAADTFVDFERGLNKAINRLRDALGDSAETPRFIETLPKRGYRFIGTVDAPVPAARTVSDTPDRNGDGLLPTGAAQTAARAGSLWWKYLALTAALFVVAASVAFVYTRRSTDSAPVVRSSLLPPAGTSFIPYNFALSPDGTHLAFVADEGGRQLLWIRALSAASAQPLSDTDGASFPFWSPDNHRVGFFADRKLKIVDVTSRRVRVLADVRRPSGATWSVNGIIVFAPDVSGPLYRIADTDGTPAPATNISDAKEVHRWPVFLPDGRHFLYVAENREGVPTAQGIFAASVETMAATQVSSEVVRNVAFALDHVFFVRGGTLTAQAFDLARLRMTGQPKSIAEREVASASAFFPSGFSISNTGLLAFQSSLDLASQLTWIDAAGNELESLPDGAYFDPNVSPDGGSVVMSCDQLGNGTSSICVYDAARGVVSRVTTGTDDRFPVWSPDGKEILFGSSGRSYRIAADGSTPPRAVTTRNNPTSWSNDGGILSFGSDAGLVSLAVTSVANDRIQHLGEGSEGQFSPDGRWIAHNGPDGIVVRQFPGPGTRLQISGYGGHQPRWSRDGKRLFYVARDKMLMAVDFDAATGTASAPRPLFRSRIVAAGFIGFQYDVAPDDRFLVNSLKSAAPPLTLLTGWVSSLAQ